MYLDLPQDINNKLAVKLDMLLDQDKSDSSLSDQIRAEIKDNIESKAELAYTAALSVLLLTYLIKDGI